MPKFSSAARMVVLVEVDVSSNWGSDCTIAQVHKQAEESARHRLQEIRGLRIIGNPTIKMITHETEC